jgi:hypothetical protein
MEVQLFVRPLNAIEYEKLGIRKFALLPRMEEFISTEVAGKRKYYQVVAVHHITEPAAGTEIYAVQTDPAWEVKKTRGIGFNV